MEEAYKALGYIGEIKLQNGRTRTGYLVKRKDFPKQICSGKQFRDKLASKTKQHSESFGIPQGSPISDLLANIYLVDFDCEIQSLVSSVGGVYRRYSDDILIILPGLSTDWQKMVLKVEGVLHATAPNLQATMHGNPTNATLAAGAAAGSSPTITCATSHKCTGNSGTITLTVGTSPTTGALLTVTDTNTHTNQPDCIASIVLTASPYTATTNYEFTYSTTVWTLNVGTALTASTSYTVSYICMGF
jgi:hypothetical protein